MLLLASYDIVFQEIPGEVTLALNLSCCPNGCPGCHSPHLMQATGETLDEALMDGLLGHYASGISCVGFMGGDNDPAEVNAMASYVHLKTSLKTAWYSGRQELPPVIDLANFDFIKLGGYVDELGGLDSPRTNQRFYRIENCKMTDATALFRKKPLSSQE